MILVDSSIWIDHFRSDDLALLAHLEADRVLMHPYVLGEIAVGSLRDRRDTLVRLSDLPQATVAHTTEALVLIDRERLWGFGLSYVDVHLLASARLMTQTRLWSRDKRLAATAERLGVA